MCGISYLAFESELSLWFVAAVLVLFGFALIAVSIGLFKRLVWVHNFIIPTCILNVILSLVFSWWFNVVVWGFGLILALYIRKKAFDKEIATLAFGAWATHTVDNVHNGCYS